MCLGCRACESACPSGVQYGVIIEDARANLEPARRRGFWDKRLRRFFLRDVFPKPGRLRWLARAMRVSQSLGLDRAAIQLGLVRGRMALMAETAHVPRQFASDVLPAFVPASGTRRYTVAFVQGCVSDVLFGSTNIATVHVLAANGCDVFIPAAQTCCGALASHFGDLEQARRQARQNIDAFLATGAEYIIINAAGCGSTLKEYHRLLAGDATYAGKKTAFVAKVRTSRSFWRPSTWFCPTTSRAAQGGLPGRLPFRSRAGHTVTAAQDVYLDPGLELVELPDSDTCCGSAGIYNMVQPEMADALLRRKMGNIAATGARAVASANAGCMMQLRLGVRQYGPQVEVLHVVDLLDRAYGANGAAGSERHG